MAALIAIGVGMGAEKLGRKISEKRLERKEQKAVKEREAIYGPGESSSSASAAVTKISKHPRKESRREADRSDKQRENERIDERRRSMSSERTLLPDDPPPQYEDVVRYDAHRR